MIKHYFENIAFQRFVLEKVCFVTAASSQNNPYRAICAFHCQDRFIEVAVDDSGDNASTGAAASSAPAAVPAHGHASSRRRGQVIKLFFCFLFSPTQTFKAILFCCACLRCNADTICLQGAYDRYRGTEDGSARKSSRRSTSDPRDRDHRDRRRHRHS